MSKMARVDISIVVPCLNEAQTIERVVKDALINAKKYIKTSYEIIVSDNGSTDGTLEILHKIRGIKIINVPVRGYGAALHWGILHSRGRFVVFGDADMSYPFSNLKYLVPVLKAQNPDLLLGTRLMGTIEPGAMPWSHQYIGTPVLTLLIRLIYRIPTTDCNSGMRVVKKDFYKTLNMRNSGMEWASELLLKTALKNGIYAEVPIDFKKDQRNKPPHLSRWSDGWRHLKAIILLKPILIYLLMLFSFLMAIFTYEWSFAVFTFFAMMFVVLFFSLLALKFLEFAIEGQHNWISNILNSNRLVSWVMMVTIIFWGAITLLPDNHLGTKMIIVGVTAVMYIWTFLIETIKTHLVNRLPDA